MPPVANHPGMSIKKETKLARGMHSQGRAVAKAYRKEFVVLYEERLRATRLAVSVEPTR